MMITELESHSDKRSRHRHISMWSHGHVYEYPQDVFDDWGYDFQADEAELRDQVNKFPSSEEVEELCSVLLVSALRELSSEILSGGIEHVKGETRRLEYARLLNSWIATAEETVAAGGNVEEIAARRKKPPKRM